MALRRAISLLRLLSTHTDGLNLSSIAATLDVPKSSLFATLHGLTEQGFLSRRGSLYFLGEEAWSLAAVMMAGKPLRQVARPFLERTMMACGETVLLAELEPDKTRFAYTDFVESQKSIRFCARIGEQRPLYPTSCGLLFLAYFSDEERNAYFRKVRLVPVTDRTAVNRAVIEKRLAVIRRTGVSVTFGNFSSDAAGFSAPIRNSDGAVVAGLVIGLPLSRGEREHDLFCGIAIETANAISAALGYSPERSANADGVAGAQVVAGIPPIRDRSKR